MNTQDAGVPIAPCRAPTEPQGPGGPPGPPEVCLHRLMQVRADGAPDAVALLAPGRPPLTFAALCRHVAETVGALNAMGVGRNDRVALVLPDGPEMATAFLGVAAGATAIPCNPAFGLDELDAYFSRLNAKALIVQAGLDSPARTVAQARGIALLELSPAPGATGLFRLSGEHRPGPARGGFAQPDDVALVLHTAGSTSRPKVVPLTHANVCLAAASYARASRLGPDDRCLNVSPLYHYHGLIPVTVASFQAGASVVYPPGFDGPRFFEWMEACRPTWYLAVASVHQAILARAAANRDVIARRPLRFIRAGGAQVPWQVKMDLERAFHVPIIESYGMTEAGLITMTAFPPYPQKPGSSGRAADSDVAIVDEQGRILPPGETGEIVVRGPGVFRGYEEEPEANRSTFIDGWFRTGDQGFLDPDADLFITGRIKEIIIRGGQKVSPREVDEVLMRHPAVAQCVTFPVPDRRLGEEVAVVVVLHQGMSATDREIHAFAAQHLAPYKVPRRIAFVGEIPKSALGKFTRIGLAEKLGLAWPAGAPAAPAAFVAPRTDLEDAVARIWCDVLGIGGVGVHDDFLGLGGDSLLATQIVARVREALGVDLSPSALYEAPTVADMAGIIARFQRGATGAPAADRILAELEGLSEEEAGRLLAAEAAAPREREPGA